MSDLPSRENDPPGPWPLAGYAPGGYMCRCRTCKAQFDGDKRAVTCLPCAVSQVKSRALEAERENEELRLAICGGEDAPGYAASLSLDQILRVHEDNVRSARRDAELAWDGETAQSWKSQASTLVERVAVLEGAARSVLMPGGAKDQEAALVSISGRPQEAPSPSSEGL